MRVEHQHYGWTDAGPRWAHGYLLPTILRAIQGLSEGKPLSVVDMGCGNGYVASRLAGHGHSVVGIDVSRDGIEIARSAYPAIRFEVCSIYDEDLHGIIGQPVDCVISLEVIEHLFYPKRLLEQAHRILKSGGHLLLSTPYHGYLKNLAFSVLNGWDRHFDVQRGGGHIKFFSRRTLARMIQGAGFRKPRFTGAGRVPWLWKAMIMIAEK